MRLLLAFWVILVVSSLACNLSAQRDESSDGQESATNPDNPAPALVPPTATPFPITDASWLLAEVCFEALLTLDNLRLVVEDSADLEAFFTRLDPHCSEPIPRPTLDLNGLILVIAGRVTQACDARLTPQALTNDQLVLQWSAIGDCPYDVVSVYAGTLTRPPSPLQITVNDA